MRQILFIGDFRFREFQAAIECLKSNSWLALAIDVDDAITRVTKQRLCPELIVIGQSHPGQFSQVAIDRLHQLVPLARLVTVLGSWCESETRTGDPWPGVLRVYWHQFSTRLDRRFLRGETGGQWNLPRTSTDAEWLLTESSPKRNLAQRRLVVIRACNLSGYQALADALNAEGYATIWAAAEHHPYVSGQSAGIWDSARLDSNEIKELKQFTQRLRPAPVIALTNFPRQLDCRRLLSAGAATVLGKPLSVSDLLNLLAGSIGDSSMPNRDAFAA